MVARFGKDLAPLLGIVGVFSLASGGLYMLASSLSQQMNSGWVWVHDMCLVFHINYFYFIEMPTSPSPNLLMNYAHYQQSSNY